MRIKVKYLILAIFMLILMRPSPDIIVGPEVSSKIFDLVIVGLATCIAVVQRKYIGHELMRSFPVRALILLSLVEMISFSIGALDSRKSVLDAVEFSRWLAYLPLLVLGYTMVKYRPEVFIWAYERSLWVLALVSLAIFVNFGGTEGALEIFYEMSKSRGMESEGGAVGLWRLASTFSNPNYFGIHAAMAAGVLISFVRLGEKISYSRVCLALVYVFFVIVSGSRTALIALAAVSVALVLVRSDFALRRSPLFAFVAFLIATTVMPVLFVWGGGYLVENTWRFSNFDNMYLSMGIRFEIWRVMIDSATGNFLFAVLGQGANRDMFAVADNTYVLMFYKNGFIGLCVLMAILVQALYRSIADARGVSFQKYFGLSVFGGTIIIAISCLTSVPFQHSQLSMIFFLLIGAGTAARGRGYAREC